MPDRLTDISRYLTTARLGRELLILPETDSTNTRIKRDHRGRAEGFVLLAERQTAGRGRLGRSFASPAGDGLYLSMLLRPRLTLQELDGLTLAAAVAVCQAVEGLAGVQPGIKWVNDVFLGGRKLCGILTESAVSAPTGYPDFAVLGIGVNLRFDPAAHPDLADIACGLAAFTAAPPSRAALAAAILNAFEPLYDRLCAGDKAAVLAPYRARLACAGKPVTVHAPEGIYPATCAGVDDDGGLIVTLPSGEQKTLRAGEISIRF